MLFFVQLKLISLLFSDKGLILIENEVKNKNKSLGNLSETRQRSQSEKSKSTNEASNENFVEIGSQFNIVYILDPVKKTKVSLDEAISLGIFDINSATYYDSTANRKLTMVEAIDQGVVNISNKNFQTSFKLKAATDNENLVKKVKTYSIRFIVDPFTNEIIPLNVANSKKLINLEKGTYNSSEKVISLKEAYDSYMALTTDDLDQPESKRAKFVVDSVRKSTTRKNMSLTSALAKNWINIGRRVYIDKQTNQEMSFSQAVDSDLLVLKKSSEIVNIHGLSKTSSNSKFKRDMSRESFQSKESFQSEFSSKSLKSSKSNLEKNLRQRTKPNR